jgi:hypothetical protein
MARKTAVQHKSPLHFETVPVAEVVKRGTNQVRKRHKTDTDALPAERRLRPRVRPRHFHGVQFYKDPDALCRIVCGFVGEGLEHGALSVLIATPEHARRIASCLRVRGVDVDGLTRRGDLVTLDAAEILQLIMIDGMPNPGMFRRVLSSAFARLRRGREHCPIRAYGEMVDLLWKGGLEAAAIRLETLWNQLATTHDFELLCGYSMGNFYKGAAIADIRGQHSHLIGRDGDVAALPNAPAAPF